MSAVSAREHRRLLVTGRVQGVGFRPFVVRTAAALGLDGTVRNDTTGVVIDAVGHGAVLDRFVRLLCDAAPAPIAVAEVRSLPAADGANPAPGFRIVASATAATVTQVCAPDFAPCPACMAELVGAGRRAGYAHIACSACGPRHAITRALPFDRERTTMARFALCADCAREYSDPTDRRYHAQLISCPACGPRLALLAMDGTPIADAADALPATLARVLAGGIVAIKGVGGFLLVCDATRGDVVAELRRRKGRPMKPLACLFADIDAVRRHCDVADDEREALESAAAPIVLLGVRAGCTLPVADLAPGLDTLGVMLPASPLLLLLARGAGRPLVATSANHAGSPTLHRDEDVRRWLTEVADAMLTDDRPLLVAQDDSVMRFCPVSRARIVVRRGRGLAPACADAALVAEAPPVLALGAHMKAAFVLGGAGVAYHSQALGDLEAAASEAAFGTALAHARTLTGAAPQTVVSDAHPGYATTRLATRLAHDEGLEARTVWHHRAHLLALLGEHGRTGWAEPVLGLVWDGTGLGEDGTLWGGEFLLADGGAVTRCAHLAPVPVLFGDRMAREPRLALAAHGARHPSVAATARALFGDAEWTRTTTALVIGRALPARTTSSMGRLFDAAAAILGLGAQVSYEGCAAMRLEALAQRGAAMADRDRRSGVPLPGPDHAGRIDGGALLSAILADLDAGLHPAAVAWRFHDALARLAWMVAARIGVRTVGATGGCWQNALLVDRLLAHRGADRRVLLHRDLPPNDENIALGQFLAVALDASRARASADASVSTF